MPGICTNASILPLLRDDAVTCGMVSDALDASGVAGVQPGTWCDNGVISAAVSGRLRTLALADKRLASPVSTAAYAEWFGSLREGEVVWVHGSQHWAFWGELCSRLALKAGVVATIVDGLTRDTRRVYDIAYPVWSRGYTGTDIIGRGVISGLDVPCGEVCPGDVAFADLDGVAVIPRKFEASVGAALADRLDAEARVRAFIECQSVAEVIRSAECL